MPVQSVNFIRTGQRSEREYAGKRETLVYQVIVQNGDSAAVAVEAAGLPQYGDPHPTDATMLARSRRVIGGEPPRYEVEIEYTPSGILFSPGQAPTASTDPLTDPPELSWSTRKVTEEIDFAWQRRTMQGGVVTGALVLVNPPPPVAIVNAAGDTFDSPIVTERSDIILTVGLNRSSFDEGLHYDFADAINLDTFRGEAPGTWKVESIEARLNLRPPAPPYYRVTYQFAFRADGWDARVLNHGYSARSAIGQKPKRVVRDGVEVVKPVPLDLDGKEQAEGADPYWLLFRHLPLRNFADLNLGI